MGRRKRATLRGAWWKQVMRQVRFCMACGGGLAKKYVKDEKRWRHVCSDCTVISYFNPRVVAGTVPVLKGKVVLGRRAIEPAKGYWTFPSGYVELGESVIDGAVRETWEEVGLKVKVQSLLGVFSYADAGVVTLVYLARVPSSQKPRPTHETSEVALFSPDQIPWKDLAFRSTREALQAWVGLSKRKKPNV